MSQEPGQEVRISDYAGRVVRRWYVVVLAVVCAILLVVLRTVGTGSQVQGSAVVYLGAPLGPVNAQPITSSIITNPTTASVFVRSDAVLTKAASASGISVGRLRSHTSVTTLQPPSTQTPRATPANPNVKITTIGPFKQRATVAAVRAMGDALIALANAYQSGKINLLDHQIAADQGQLAVLQDAERRAQQALNTIGRSGLSATDKAAASAAYVATLSSAATQIDQIQTQLTSNQILRTTASTIEAAGYVQQPSGSTVTATKRSSSLIVAVFAGLIVGVLLALTWDAMRRRPSVVRR